MGDPSDTENPWFCPIQGAAGLLMLFVSSLCVIILFKGQIQYYTQRDVSFWTFWLYMSGTQFKSRSRVGTPLSSS